MSYDSYDENEQIQIKILNNTINLDEPCWKCTVLNSYGSYGDSEPLRIPYLPDEPCEHCDNTRFTLTEVGQAIVNLVRRHTK